MPHLGQALCGSLRSWQLGHSETVMGVSASCERRLEVRALEWRRFGFGIADSFQAFSQATLSRYCRDAWAAAWDRFQFYVFILLRRSASAVHRASTWLASQAQTSLFRFSPQRGQSPLQSSRQSALAGRESNTCSRNT